MKPALILLLMGAVLCGCSGSGLSGRYGTCSGKSFNQLLEATDLKPLFNDMARELCGGMCPGGVGSLPGHDAACSDLPRGNAYSLLVTDFVDIQSFTPASQGLLMGELMRGALTSVCGNKITQAEFARFFNLNEKGLVVLSRKVSEIRSDEYDQKEAIVGTYSYLTNKIVVFSRRINIDTGRISRMVTREMDYSCSGGAVSYSVK